MQNKENGFVYNPKETITHSSGNARMIETTSLCLLLWFKTFDKCIEMRNGIEKGIKGIMKNNKIGYYASTQGTILSLKVLIEYEKTFKTKYVDDTDDDENCVELHLNGRKIGKLFSQNIKSSSITIPHEYISTYKENEINKLKITLKKISKPINLSSNLEFYSCEEPISEKCLMKMDIRMNNNKFKEGDLLTMNIRIWNVSNNNLGMVLCKIGIYCGCEIRYHELRELRKECKISYFELFDDYLVFYFRDFKGNDEKELKIEMECKTPGKYSSNPSEIYEYYNDSEKYYLENEPITIKH